MNTLSKRLRHIPHLLHNLLLPLEEMITRLRMTPRALKVQELAPNHTVIPGDRGMYTAVFVLAMNKELYEGLSDDLKAVIDKNSGMEMAKFTGMRWDVAEQNGIDATNSRNNPVVELSADEVAKIRAATSVVTETWVKDMGDKGKMLLDDAEALLDQYSQ